MDLISIKCVISDLDETLVISEEIYYEWLEKVFERFGKEINFELYFNHEIYEKQIDEINKQLKKKDREGLSYMQKEAFSKLRRYMKPDFTSVKLMPGAKEFLENLKMSGIRLAITTNSKCEEFKEKILNNVDQSIKNLFIDVFDLDESNGILVIMLFVGVMSDGVDSNIIFVANEKFNQDVNVDHVNLTKINSFHDVKFIDGNILNVRNKHFGLNVKVFKP
ncbi:3913_t:CDS:2 [Gigaspora margarita]|uniref:3913_t:CDS:1 n=1 Tax=Gigaspora margarita TaxID=4874 RepID=A0ABN7UM72_GIGMA|nr:3913_t:CDS:2 [Gigaspora margarita]